MKLVYWD